MCTQVAVMSIIVKELELVEDLNSILYEYSQYYRSAGFALYREKTNIDRLD